MKLTPEQCRLLVLAVASSAAASFKGALDHDVFEPPPRPPAPDVPEVLAWYRRREAEEKGAGRERRRARKRGQRR